MSRNGRPSRRVTRHGQARWWKYGIVCEDCGHAEFSKDERLVAGTQLCPRCGPLSYVGPIKRGRWLHWDEFREVMERAYERHVRELVDQAGAELDPELS